MSSRKGWLLNNINPASVDSNEFDVRAGVVRLFASNLANSIPLQQFLGDDSTGNWVNVSRNGRQILLSDSNNNYVEFVSGRYRIDGTGAGPNARIWYEEEFYTDGDNRTIYAFTNVSGGTSGGGGGGGLSSVSTGAGDNTVIFNGNGTLASPLTAKVNLSSDPSQLLSKKPDGILGSLIHQDSQSVALTGYGNTTVPLEAFVKVSSASGNQIQTNVDGIFSAENVSHQDTNTVAIIGNGQVGTPIQANAKISSSAGNVVIANPDGLYVPNLSTNVIHQDSTTVTLTGNGQVATPLVGTVKISATAGNNIVANSDGLYVSAAAASILIIPLLAGTISTKYGPGAELALGSFYFDPNALRWGLKSTSTATLYMLLETTSVSNTANGELYRRPNASPPGTIVTTPTTSSLTAALVSVDVSVYFRPGALASIFVARAWVGTPNGSDQTTVSGAWIEIQP